MWRNCGPAVLTETRKKKRVGKAGAGGEGAVSGREGRREVRRAVGAGPGVGKGSTVLVTASGT